MENIIKKKIELLTTPVWSTKDIMAYFQISKTTAYTYKNKVIDKYGVASYGSKYVNRDYILEIFETTAEKELKSLGAIANEEKL